MSQSNVRLSVGLAILFASMPMACGKKVPASVRATLDTQRAAVVLLAHDAAKACASIRPPTAPTLASPAKGTPLESDPKVTEVFVSCAWPDAKNPALSNGNSFSALRGTSHVPKRPATMPGDYIENSCKQDVHDCSQVVVPSRFSANENSLDLKVKYPTTDGGEVEVIATFEAP